MFEVVVSRQRDKVKNIKPLLISFSWVSPRLVNLLACVSIPEFPRWSLESGSDVGSFSHHRINLWRFSSTGWTRLRAWSLCCWRSSSTETAGRRTAQRSSRDKWRWAPLSEGRTAVHINGTRMQGISSGPQPVSDIANYTTKSAFNYMHI